MDIIPRSRKIPDKIEWAIILDDRGSTEIYPTEEEARKDSEKFGAPLVKITNEYFMPSTIKVTHEII